MTELDAAVMRVAALKVLKEYVTTEYDAARQTAGRLMGAGDRKQVRSPLDGEKIASVYMTDPEPQSVITDERALTAWVEERYPGLCEAGYKVIGSEAELISVLFAHAPHLLKRMQRVKREALADIHARSLAAERPVGPGGELDLPGLEIRPGRPNVACRPDPDHALDTVLQMVRNRQFEIETPRVLEAS